MIRSLILSVGFEGEALLLNITQSLFIDQHVLC